MSMEAVVEDKKVKIASKSSISEGLASILPIETNEVFYNPVQVFNRDLSLLIVSVFGRSVYNKKEQLNVLEGLAASGLRSIRYAKELRFGDYKIFANDIESVAVERIRRNMEHNEESSIEVINSDVIHHMHCEKNKYSVIDLDPYGSCGPFLDAAVSSVKPSGLLCITSTDGGVLCGNQPDLSFIRYGGYSVKKNFSHEMGLRVMLHAVASAAARHKRGIKVLAAFSIDFYFRVFVQVIDSGKEALRSMDSTGLLFQCINCEFHINQPFSRVDGHNRKPARLLATSTTCPECDSCLALGGLMYTGPLCEDEFVNSCLDVIEDEKNEFPGVSSWIKLKGLLYGIKTELKNVPLFYTIPGLTRSFKVSPPKLRVFYHWLKQLGFQVSGSHRTPNAIKTDAPASVVFDLVRIYVQQLSPSHTLEKAISLQIPEGIEIDFNIKLEESKKSSEKIPIYIPNPAAFWGPKPRAQQSTGTNDLKRQKVSH